MQVGAMYRVTALADLFYVSTVDANELRWAR